MASIERFSAHTRTWFDAAFDAPTPAQDLGWDAISRGEHTLVLAPTGSGKTLAAFLWAIDRLLTTPAPATEAARCRVLYVSPLKALTYDVERNLRAPLTGIALAADRAGDALPTLRVATRTGDTSQAERRDIVRHPPDVLITTPESLYLMLTSGAREVLASVEQVIVDEIHAMAGTKRGAHLALSLERLDRIVTAGGRPSPQRIGLSATQRPLDEVARFLGGRTAAGTRPVAIVDAGVRKPLELQVIVPVEDMGELGRPLPQDELVLSGPAAGDPEVRSSIWPAIHPILLDLIGQHRSTLIFVNSRRLAERLSARLNELSEERGGPAELVRAHHGSIAREQRLDIEDALKAGKLPALVATSSLELGIDMGAIDLVVQVESPTSVASALQRIGRAGHQVGEPSRGRMFPKFRGDLVSAAVVAMRMHEGKIEETSVPRNPLDVLAQQVVAMVAMEPMSVDEVFDVVTGAYPFADLSREVFEGVLDMLAGRYPSDEFAELRPRVSWDRVSSTLTARQGARMLAVTSGGTIPDRGLYGVFTPEGNRVGELDEEMVYESRVGETFLLGASTWRIEEITRDRVIVTPAPGQPGKMPFWHGDAVGRPLELGRAIGAFLRAVDSWSDDDLRDRCDLDDLAVRNLRQYVAEEKEVCGAVPTDRQIVVERFRDELGDWRVCVLTPFGARIHAPWALAVERRIKERLDVEVQSMWSDDGFVLRLPEADEVPPTTDVLLDPDEVEDLVVGEVANSALFAARFRENAARALLLPRRRPGSRTPLWQQRQRAADLLAVAANYGSFPILLETYRECLRDVFDLPGLIELSRDIRSRKVRVVSVETPRPSPFAQGLAFAYIATFLYEGDAPLAERRAQALSLDRELLAELLGADELRELIDPAALASVEAELQHLDERRHARSVDEASDLLRRLGDLTPAELGARSLSSSFADELVASRRALPVRIAGEERLVLAEDVGRYRDALGVQPPAGVPEAFLEPVEDPVGSLLGRWARVHGPFLAGELAARFGLPVAVVESLLEQRLQRGLLLRGEFRPDGTEREWCDPEVLRLLRQRSLAALRKEIEPTSQDALARFLPAWHGVGSDHRGLDRLYDVVRQLQGVPIPASVLERDVLPARVADYSPRLLDELAASGEIMWAGAGPLGRDDGRVMLFLREQAALLLPDAPPSERPSDEEHERLREVLSTRGACFFRELAGTDDARTLDALWDLVWAGEVTNDTFAALRSPAAGSAPARRSKRPRPGSLTVLGPPRAQGRWSLVGDALFGEVPSATERAHARAGVLLERHGVLTREAVRGEGVAGGFAGVYPVLRAMEESGRVRRGYFVDGLGGAQFALPGAVDRLRQHRDGDAVGAATVVLAATDPANTYGLTLPWPSEHDARPARAAGAYVVLVDGIASLYLERGGRSLRALRSFDGEWEAAGIAALLQLTADGRLKRLALEKVADELVPLLRDAGFVATPKGLVRYA